MSRRQSRRSTQPFRSSDQRLARRSVRGPGPWRKSVSPSPVRRILPKQCQRSGRLQADKAAGLLGFWPRAMRFSLSTSELIGNAVAMACLCRLCNSSHRPAFLSTRRLATHFSSTTRVCRSMDESRNKRNEMARALDDFWERGEKKKAAARRWIAVLWVVAILVVVACSIWMTMRRPH
jgi:preprotein translocase subunit Sec61beta